MHPPRFAEMVLRAVLEDGVVGRSILGDLREEFGRRSGRGSRFGASWWYRQEAVGVLVRALRRRVLGQGDWERRPQSVALNVRRGDPMIHQLFSDVKFALRSLSRAPGFSFVTAFTLALAIGANAAIFSVVNGVLLQPLPFPEADRLVVFLSTAPGLGMDREFGVASEFELQYAEADAVADLGLYSTFGGTMRVDGVSERLQMTSATGSLFSTLGVQPLMGRLAVEDELLAEFLDRPVLISYANWRTRFGSDPGIIGKTADIAGSQRTIIGVMDSDFRFPDDDVAAWIPFQQDPETVQPGNFSFQLVGRMKDGVEAEDVLNQIIPLAKRLEEDYASAPRYVAFLQQMEFRPVVRSLKEVQVGNLDQPLWILLGTVGVVLLIACANVANLFLVRAESKQRDMAVRAALGSGRGRLVRGYMAEAFVLAMMGGAAGALIAWGGIPLLLQAAPEGIPRVEEIGLDPMVLGFTAGISLFAAFLFGLLPAVRYTAPGLLTRLRFAGRGAASGRESHFARNSLVVVQSALALVLLVGSGLLVRSFWELKNTDPGFETENILTFQYALPGDRYETDQDNAAFHTRFMEELRSIPGVASVGAVENIPIDESTTGTAFEAEGAVATAEGLGSMLFFTYSAPGYFETMDIRMEAGRDFTNSDHETPWGAVIVSRTIADDFWPGEDPVGRRLRAVGDTTGWDTVIGVVEDVRTVELREAAQGLVYYPFVARPGGRSWVVSSPGFVVRANNAEQLIPVVRDRLRAIDATLPMYRIQTMEQIVEDSVVRLSFTMLTLGVAAIMALVLGAVGLYGVLSYLVVQRTQEIGVRLALGAEAGQVRRMVVVQGAKLAGVGMIVGLIASVGLTRLLQGLLYGTEALDLTTFGAMSAVMIVVGLFASYVPARRASSVNPIESMRLE